MVCVLLLSFGIANFGEKTHFLNGIAKANSARNTSKYIFKIFHGIVCWKKLTSRLIGKAKNLLTAILFTKYYLEAGFLTMRPASSFWDMQLPAVLANGLYPQAIGLPLYRSEERRVGKECRY